MGKTILMTSAEANKRLRSLNEEIRRICVEEQNNSSYLLYAGENVEDVKPNYNFAECQEKLNALYTEVRAIKHAINVFNSTTIVGNTGMTIDEVLVALPQYTNMTSKFVEFINRPQKSRETMRATANSVPFKYANYDRETVLGFFDRYDEFVRNLQIELDKINLTVQFEVKIPE